MPRRHKQSMPCAGEVLHGYSDDGPGRVWVGPLCAEWPGHLKFVPGWLERENRIILEAATLTLWRPEKGQLARLRALRRQGERERDATATLALLGKHVVEGVYRDNWDSKDHWPVWKECF